MVNKTGTIKQINSKTGTFKKAVIWQALFGAMVLPMQADCSVGGGSDDKYGVRIQTEGKIGKTRNIVRPSALIPLYQTNTSLLHMTLIGLADSTHALEGNMGVGYRNMVNDNIIGAFAFYDIRKSSRGNVIHQATLGAEWFREYLEFRANVYLPQTKKFEVSKNLTSDYKKATAHKVNAVDIATGTETKFEKALPGFDLEVGAQIPGLEDLTTRLAYYRFGYEKNVETRNGVRGTVGYQVNDFLELNAETSYDNQRKLNYFAGVTLGYTFDKANKQSSLTRLEKEMTSIPIRDIDAVVAMGKDHLE